MASCPLFLLALRPPPPLAGRARLRRRPGFRCAASYGPRERPPRPRQQKQLTQRPDRGDAVDPVDFLAKIGVSDRAFAQFLRDRHKALKDRRWALHSRFIDLKEASSGFELMGMHRPRQHRVDFMEWAPEYNYVDDFDKGDNGVDVEDLIHRMNEEYWEPGDVRSRKSRVESLAAPDGPMPQTKEHILLAR